MRYFPIPFTVDEEEKVFGGYVSLRQALYIFLSMLGIRIFWFPLPLIFSLRQALYIFLSMLGIRIFWFPLPLIFRIILFIIFAGLMTAFGFLKIGGVYFDSYTIMVVKYLLRRKKYRYGEEKE